VVAAADGSFGETQALGVGGTPEGFGIAEISIALGAFGVLAVEIIGAVCGLGARFTKRAVAAHFENEVAIRADRT